MTIIKHFIDFLIRLPSHRSVTMISWVEKSFPSTKLSFALDPDTAMCFIPFKPLHSRSDNVMSQILTFLMPPHVYVIYIFWTSIKS